MIVEMKPVTLAEVSEIIKDNEEKKELQEFIKKFNTLSKEDALKLVEELRALDNLKLKEEYVIKIADFLPRDAEDLHKIFTEVSLEEKEVNDILGIVGNYGK